MSYKIFHNIMLYDVLCEVIFLTIGLQIEETFGSMKLRNFKMVSRNFFFTIFENYAQKQSSFSVKINVRYQERAKVFHKILTKSKFKKKKKKMD